MQILPSILDLLWPGLGIKTKPIHNSAPAKTSVPTSLNCRVVLEKNQNSNTDIFNVQICGIIYNQFEPAVAKVQISIVDITDETEKALPVFSRVKQWQMRESTVFQYNSSLGNLKQGNNMISDWVSVAKIYLDWLTLAHKGKRNLLFEILILSGQNENLLINTDCTSGYDNPNFGYNDLEINLQRAKTLAISLALAVSAADKKLYLSEIETIKNWAKNNFNIPGTSKRENRKIEKSLDKTIKLFQNGYVLNTQKVCSQIVSLIPTVQRYGIIDLALHVAQAKGQVCPEEIDMLEKIAQWLELDMDKFREMMQVILPISIHQQQNPAVLLGLTPDMQKEDAIKHLNNEYRKWNQRASNSDPHVQAQANHMLELISKARSQFNN